jgi:hypothetical protein
MGTLISYLNPYNFIKSDNIKIPYDIIITIMSMQHTYNNPYTIGIYDDEPEVLYKKILLDPIKYIEKFGYDTRYSIILSIVKYNNNNITPKHLHLMYKIANHLNLDLTNIKNYDDLCNLINIHIVYSPPISNIGYLETEQHFNKIKNDDI